MTLLQFCILAIYFCPTIVAFLRKASHPWAIFWVNLFCGWLIFFAIPVGWLITMLWAIFSEKRYSMKIIRTR